MMPGTVALWVLVFCLSLQSFSLGFRSLGLHCTGPAELCFLFCRKGAARSSHWLLLPGFWRGKWVSVYSLPSPATSTLHLLDLPALTLRKSSPSSPRCPNAVWTLSSSSVVQMNSAQESKLGRIASLP